MLGCKERGQFELFVTGSLRQRVPDDHILVRVDRNLDLAWLRGEVADLYCADNGRPGIDPEVAGRLTAHLQPHHRAVLRKQPRRQQRQRPLRAERAAFPLLALSQSAAQNEGEGHERPPRRTPRQSALEPCSPGAGTRGHPKRTPELRGPLHS